MNHLICTKRHLTTFEAQFTKKLSDNAAKNETNVPYKACI